MKTTIDIRFIKNIEARVYPEHMQMMQCLDDIYDLADYCECEVDELFVLTGDNWYLIAAEHEDFVEIVDLCADGNIGMEIIKLIAVLRKRWAGKRVTMDARESTSYPIIRALIRRFNYRVIRDEIWSWDDEVMHDIELQM